MMTNAVEQAVRAAGGPVAVARALNITHAAVRKWCVKSIPAERVLPLARLANCSPSDLRPDIYPAQNDTAGNGADTSNAPAIAGRQ